jgi:hypothetical protein
MLYCAAMDYHRRDEAARARGTSGGFVGVRLLHRVKGKHSLPYSGGLSMALQESNSVDGHSRLYLTGVGSPSRAVLVQCTRQDCLLELE